MKASFNIDIKNLTPTKDVWFRDAYFTDASGTATFTEEETKQITSILSTVGSTFKQINSISLTRVTDNDTIREYVKTFNNTKVREGKKITNTAAHTRELMKWVEEKLNKNILSVKKPDAIRKRQLEKNEVMRTLRGSSSDLTKVFDMQNGIVDAKSMIIKKLQQMKQVTSTFVQTEDGFKVTNPEGFVAVDKLKGNAVKLVDRLEFSHLNFTAQKAWSK
jgi:hypothetical protein